MAELKVWTAEALAEYARLTKDVEIGGGTFKITKLSAEIIEDVEKKNNTFNIIQKGLTEPALTPDQLKKLPADMVIELTKAITEFSGLTAEQAEKN